MRKSPGFDEGHWLFLPNGCPRFCATCISESFRSCWMQLKPKNHTVLSRGKSVREVKKFAACRIFSADTL